MNPEIYSFIIPKLLEKGALDVYLNNIIMKKNRPGVKLSVIVEKDKKDEIIEEIFKHTTTFGIRIIDIDREVLMRKFEYVDTKYGKVKVKIGSRNENILQTSPEYEDVKKLAEKNNISINELYNEVIKNI